MQGIFCYVGGTDVDDRGAPIEYGEAEDEGLWGSGSQRGSWGFSLPFFSIDSGTGLAVTSGLSWWLWRLRRRRLRRHRWR